MRRCIFSILKLDQSVYNSRFEICIQHIHIDHIVNCILFHLLMLFCQILSNRAAVIPPIMINLWLPILVEFFRIYMNL